MVTRLDGVVVSAGHASTEKCGSPPQGKSGDPTHSSPRVFVFIALAGIIALGIVAGV